MSGDEYVLQARVDEEGVRELLAPSVGIFAPSVETGQLVGPGQLVGTIEVLGVRRSLLVPPGVSGRVGERAGRGSSRVPVEYGGVLLRVEASALAESVATAGSSPVEAESGLAYVAPMSGRFYSRPSPTEPPFVGTDDTVAAGQTIGLLEVMKTFNRLVYQGDGLPESAIVQRVLPEDGDDVSKGDVILALVPANER